jgi:outer membrane protein assembly factor BamD
MKVLSAPAGALSALLLLAGVSGCATLSGEPGEPNYASDAETNLARGNEAFESKNYLEAEKYFQYVRSKYPFLDAAREAELRLADTFFERDQYIEARDAYQNFVKLHPSWPKVDYAAFKAALTHYKDMPSDFFLFPSSREKDQTEVKAAVQSMTDFVRTFPKSQYVPQAKEIIDECRRRLAEHELYVANFYRSRQRWRAVANRLETVANDYKGLGYDEKALFGMYEAYSHLMENDKARKALEELINRMPGTPAAQRAKDILAKS